MDILNPVGKMHIFHAEQSKLPVIYWRTLIIHKSNNCALNIRHASRRIEN